MKSLILFRERLKAIYADYSIYIQPVLKFALALFVFLLINSQLGYLKIFNQIFVVLILALISAVLPMSGTVIFGMILIIGHCFGLGVEVGGFALILFFLMLLLYFRFTPKDALALLLTPIAFFLQVPASIPISLGLLRGPEAAVSSAFGVISYQFIYIVHNAIEPMKADPGNNLLSVLQVLSKQMFNNRVVLLVIAFASAAVIASVICKYLSTFSRESAIVISGVVYIVIMTAGTAVMRLHNNIAGILFGTIASGVIAWILNSFVFCVDYSKSKFIQFEDDQYYYFVKAIPKLSGTKSSREELSEEEKEQPYEASGLESLDLESQLEDSLKNL